jgi:hypothetical protein
MDLLGPSEVLRAWARRAGRLLVVPIRNVDGTSTTPGMMRQEVANNLK